MKKIFSFLLLASLQPEIECTPSSKIDQEKEQPSLNPDAITKMQIIRLVGLHVMRDTILSFTKEEEKVVKDLIEAYDKNPNSLMYVSMRSVRGQTLQQCFGLLDANSTTEHFKKCIPYQRHEELLSIQSASFKAAIANAEKQNPHLTKDQIEDTVHAAIHRFTKTTDKLSEQNCINEIRKFLAERDQN